MTINFFQKIMIKKIFQKLIHILNILLIVASLVLALISIFKKQWIEAFIQWMKVLVESLWFWNYIIAAISSFIEAFPVLWVVVPWQNILLIVWWFFGEISKTNLIYVMIVACLWAILWNFVGFLLWKYFWDWFFRKYWMWFWIGLTEVKYLKKWIHKWWAAGIIFGKFHPMTRAFLPFIAWSMWMNSVKFMIYNIVWSIIRAVTIVWLWVLFVEYYEILLEHIGKIMLVIFAWIAFYIYKFKRVEFKKYMEEKNQEMEELYWPKK